MKKPINYMNATTGEITESHAIAMEWYRDHNEVKLIGWSETLNEWIERGAWVW
jgi:hypothetical protein